MCLECNRCFLRFFLYLTAGIIPLLAGGKPRARDLGIQFDGTTGQWNAITDVAGVEVGHATIIKGKGTLKVGKGPVRTGVTAVHPRGKNNFEKVFAGYFSLNGNGEMTGSHWVEESGFLEGPVMITNTHSVGTVIDAVVAWSLNAHPNGYPVSLPVVAETWDGRLNDINGFHVKKKDTFHALNNAKSGPLEEGNIGGGTGMVAFQFKGGIGTSSRLLPEDEGGYTVGVLVQANFGRRTQLMISGVPVGKAIDGLMPEIHKRKDKDGSIIVVVGTDAPLLPYQLKRVAKRVTLGLARTGSISSNSSGDIFIAFTTSSLDGEDTMRTSFLKNNNLNSIFEATIQATEEAIINAMIAAETMTGINGNTIHALPHKRVLELLR
jgi:L-aminopeptidase/D-esterase-like protein